MADTTLRDRAVLRVSGDDPRGFLQGLVTQDVTAVGGAAPRWAGLLTPQGKALFDFLMWDGGDGTILLDCEATQSAAFAQRLSLYRLRRRIDIAPADVAVHWSPDNAGGVLDPRLAALGTRWLAVAGASDAGPAWRAHRLSHGVTEGVGELGSGTTLWLECNADELGGVSFVKGCYIGQENTARMHHRAKVNRRLVVAPIGQRGERTRACYPEIGVMVELRRVEALGDAVTPDWLAAALRNHET